MNKDYFHNKCSCGKIKYKYAKLCQKCFWKKWHRVHKGKNHPNWKGRKSKICKNCGKKLHITSVYRNYQYCASCAKKGKKNPNYIHGKTDKNICKQCGKHICDAAIYCNKCDKTLHKERLIKSFAKVKFNKHHLDLNHQNNQKSNIWILPKGKHQLFHRIAYHYLLEKFIVKDISKYKEIGKSSSLVLHKVLLEERKKLLDEGHYFNVILGGGSCKWCKECKIPCQTPQFRAIPIEATGIHVIETLRKMGLFVNFPVKKSFYRVGVLLWD